MERAQKGQRKWDQWLETWGVHCSQTVTRVFDDLEESIEDLSARIAAELEWEAEELVVDDDSSEE